MVRDELAGTRLYATTGTSVARLDETPSGWTVDVSLSGSGAQCLALDPAAPDTVYVGLATGGVRTTKDGGRTWTDRGLAEEQVFSMAVSAADGAVYAGTEPSALYRSDDGGERGRSSRVCSSCPRDRRGASRPGRGRRTCAGSLQVRTTQTPSSRGSSWVG